MLNNFLESLYNKVFVNIIVKNATTDVYVEVCSKKGVLRHQKGTFETTHINEKMFEYVTTYTAESPYFYISILDYTKEQGVIPSCDKHHFEEFYDLSTSEYRCRNENWAYYTSKTDLNDMEKKYQTIGLDMIFSPFSIIENFFKDKIESSLAMYILVQEESLSLMIFDTAELLYGEHIDMAKVLPEHENLTMSTDDIEDADMHDDMSLELDDLDVDDVIEDIDELENIDDLDDFADIEDLDEIEDIDDFSHDDESIEESEPIEDEETNASSESFTQDYERFAYIKASLGKFYNDEKYKSQFIENIYIADSVGVSKDLKHFLEEEMFLNVYIRNTEIHMEVASLVHMEIKL